MAVLFGRSVEQAELDRLIEGVRAGVSAALVVRGEAGIGKSALLDYAAACADGLRVLRGVGVESEAELPFSALHLLLRGELGRVGALPAPQAAALRGALGLASADGRDRFLIGLAVLSLLAELAEDAPVLCLVDDAQWLDRASAEALLFAARRLGADKIGMVFAARGDGRGFPAAGLPERTLTGLDRGAAAELLAARVTGAAPEVMNRVLDDAAGNPLALIELPDLQLEPSRPSFAISTVPVEGRVREAFGEQLRRLPAPVRALLTIAAAEDTGDLAVLLRAGATIGGALPDLAFAEQAGLVRLTERSIAFRHPLIRAAAYQTAPLAARLAAHLELAQIFGELGDDDRRAWHLAAGASGHDDEIAAELDRAAEHAGRRGGHSAAAAAHERAAQLTASADGRGRRLAAAAHSAATAGEHDRAAMLAERAGRLLPDGPAKARLAPIRAAAELRRGSPRAAGRGLLAAAATVADPEVAAPLLVEAARHGWFGADRSIVAEAADRLAALARVPARLSGWTRATAAIMAGDLAEGVPVLRDLADGRWSDPPQVRLLVAFALHTAGADAPACELAENVVAECRALGALDLLPQALQVTAQIEAFLGRYGRARALATEAMSLAHDSGQGHWNGLFVGVLARVAACEGDDETTHALTAELFRAAGRSSPPIEAWAGAALGLLDLGHRRYESALDHLDPVVHGPARYSLAATFALPDHVEAAVRAGRPELVGDSAARFATFAEHSRSAWARSTALRCKALTAPDQAERYFAEAVRVPRDAERPLERARTELLYGEWLRRSRRRAEARRLLRSALETFERIDAHGWSGRARTELRASGETAAVPDAPGDALAVLTPQERQVVQLAASGLSNRDIGAQLFLSHRTVSYHLYKAFPKLGIASRAELARLYLEAAPR
ncbi:ATP-binding protein [Actinomadura opuntiae]|uniref:ATP-binding protein n=1 Tax=Actinomadura sp. OS1-43 TaxID=604315 RepID=UPI00255AAF02|nr:LuxR family transcriptional regulator [Actinomadura sp. OS1-43]MDL4817330.1 LuxR C-terminal-related transcriptional regulator [Actinomadura sp. OS1-43]